jgi:4-alpha-glucanotransferase
VTPKRWSALGRHAGVMIPLFSLVSRDSWGVGEIPDLVPAARWAAAAGFDFIQVLPVNEMAPGQHSPYSALSALALDPVFVRVPGLVDFTAIGGVASLSRDDRDRLDALRRVPRVDFHNVQELKQRVLRTCYARFAQDEWRVGTPRAQALDAFIARERAWLEPYALFRAMHAAHHGLPWWEWDSALRTPEGAAAERRRFEDDIRFHQYLQWLAIEQWTSVTAAMGDVGVFGDLPFMVGGDSSDVWAQQHAFAMDATVGVPPDAFSATGQDWGVPVYRWDVQAREDFAWFRARARRGAELFAGYRVDHLVGLYRTYVRPADGSPHYFTPSDESDQIALGERLLRIFMEPGACVVAEDLGTVPDFVRASMARVGVPGFKVTRWERAWNSEEQPFLDPATYPEVSVATTGTHDTETLAVWWETVDRAERDAFCDLLSRTARRVDRESPTLTEATRWSVLDLMLSSASKFVILPIQDLFGWRDRINTPATVGDENWTFRVATPIDQWMDGGDALSTARALRRMCHRASRRRPRMSFRVGPEARP